MLFPALPVQGTTIFLAVLEPFHGQATEVLVTPPVAAQPHTQAVVDLPDNGD